MEAGKERASWEGHGRRGQRETSACARNAGRRASKHLIRHLTSVLARPCSELCSWIQEQNARIVSGVLAVVRVVRNMHGGAELITRAEARQPPLPRRDGSPPRTRLRPANDSSPVHSQSWLWDADTTPTGDTPHAILGVYTNRPLYPKPQRLYVHSDSMGNVSDVVNIESVVTLAGHPSAFVTNHDLGSTPVINTHICVIANVQVL